MALAITLIPHAETKGKNLNLEFGGERGVYVAHNQNIIRPGISSSESILLRETEQQSREVLGREKQREYESSHTSSSSSYEIVSEDKINNCVEYVKKRTGITRPIGSGGRLGINAAEPIVGAIGVEKGGVPHAVFIEKIDGDIITIVESNWKKNYITRRVLKRSDFMGYII